MTAFVQYAKLSAAQPQRVDCEQRDRRWRARYAGGAGPRMNMNQHLLDACHGGLCGAPPRRLTHPLQVDQQAYINYSGCTIAACWWRPA